MRKINIYLNTIWVVLLIGFQSCELESEMYDAINPTIFPTTEEDVEALITGNVYGVFQSNGYDGIFNVANGIMLMNDILSDYGDCSWRAGWPELAYGRMKLQSDFVDLQWRYVPWLSKMTLTLDRMEEVDIDEELKQKRIAELRCGRGFLAFLLYDFYGPIMIADLETLKNPLEEKILPRLTEEEMQDYIVTELTEAAKYLPYSYEKGDSDYGRFTKGLAHMVLFKFYMQTENWAKAEEMGRELMKPEYGYELVDEYKDIFTLANEKNSETIWAVNCLPGYQEHIWHPHVLPTDYPTDPDHVVKWNGFKMTWQFLNTYEEEDKRKETIIYEYEGTDGTLHNEELDVPRGGQLQYGAAPMKYEIDKATTGQNNQIDWIVYRYADAITLLAEAIVRNGGAITEEAVDLLNQVRTRAGLEAYKMNSFTDSRDFLDKLLMERAHELYYEGSRRQDLIRDGSYVEAMERKARALGEVTTAGEYQHRAPLPQAVINEGKGLIEQNPGY